LYDGKLFHFYDHRFATYTFEGEEAKVVELNTKLPTVKIDFLRFISKETAIRRNPRLGHSSGLLAVRNVTSRTNERGVIATIIPSNITDYSVRIIRNNGQPLQLLSLLTIFNSFVFDYLARQRIGGTNLSNYIIEQTPIPPPNLYTPDLLAYIVPRVLELVYTAWDLRPFADDVWGEAGVGGSGLGIGEKTPTPNHEPRTPNHAPLIPLQKAILRQWQANRDVTNGGHEGALPPTPGFGTLRGDSEKDTNPKPLTPNPEKTNPFPHPPFKWDDARRAQLRADLDGLYGHLYGLSREELAYILDTFPIVRRKDESRWGEYRTKRLVLEAYDEIGGSGLVR